MGLFCFCGLGLLFGSSLNSTLVSVLVSVKTVSLASTLGLGGLFSVGVSFFGSAFDGAFATGFVLGFLVGFEIRSLLGLGGFLAASGVTIVGLAACKSSI